MCTANWAILRHNTGFQRHFEVCFCLCIHMLIQNNICTSVNREYKTVLWMNSFTTLHTWITLFSIIWSLLADLLSGKRICNITYRRYKNITCKSGAGEFFRFTSNPHIDTHSSRQCWKCNAHKVMDTCCVCVWGGAVKFNLVFHPSCVQREEMSITGTHVTLDGNYLLNKWCSCISSIVAHSNYNTRLHLSYINVPKPILVSHYSEKKKKDNTKYFPKMM